MLIYLYFWLILLVPGNFVFSVFKLNISYIYCVSVQIYFCLLKIALHLDEVGALPHFKQSKVLLLHALKYSMIEAPNNKTR